MFADELPVSQFGNISNAMGNNYLIESFVNRWVLNDADKGSDTRAGANQVEVSACQQMVEHQGTGGLAADENLIADLDILQTGGQRTIRHFDTQKFQFFIVVGAGNAICPQQWLALHLHTQHEEMPIFKPQRSIPGGFETEQGVIPVMDIGNVLDRKAGHCGFSNILEFDCVQCMILLLYL